MNAMKQGKAEVIEVQGLHTTLTPARAAGHDHAPLEPPLGLQDRATNPGQTQTHQGEEKRLPERLLRRQDNYSRD